jgi:hypothetical protein
MRLKLFLPATVFVAAPIVALAQQDTSIQSLKPTIEEAQKLVETQLTRRRCGRPSAFGQIALPPM